MTGFSFQKIRNKLVFLAFLLITLPSCNKYSIHDSIINFTRNTANLEAKEINIDVGKISYLENTSPENIEREVLVLVHGFGSEKDNWNHFADTLSQQYHLIIPDLPGNGQSTQNLTLDYTIDNQTKYLHSFLQNLNTDKIHLIGNSMGGAICIRYAFLYPENVKSIVLISSHGAVKTPSYVDHLYKETGQIPMLNINNVEDFKLAMDIATEQSRYIPRFMLQVLTERKIARKKIESKMFTDITKDINQLDILPDIKAPVLILWGEKDRILHVNNADLFHQRLPNSKKVILKNIGHIPQFEDPKRTGEIVKLFYNGLSRG